MVEKGNFVWFLGNDAQCDEAFCRFLAKVFGCPVYGTANKTYNP